MECVPDAFSPLDRFLDSKRFRGIVEESIERVSRVGPLLSQVINQNVRSGIAFSRWLFQHHSGFRESMEEALAEVVPAPPVITAIDLERAVFDFAFRGLEIRDENLFFMVQNVFDDSDWLNFKAHVYGLMGLPRCTPAISICNPIRWPNSELPEFLWESDSGLSVGLIKGASNGHDPENARELRGLALRVGEDDDPDQSKVFYRPPYGADQLMFRVWGNATPNAICRACKQIQIAIETISKSILLAGLARSPNRGLRLVQQGDDLCFLVDVEDFSSDEAAFKRHFGSSSETMSNETPHEWSNDIVLSYFRRSLKLFFGKPEKKDTIGRRLRNALHLLAECDQAMHESVRVSLAFSAIEAVLCDKNDGIAERLGRNASTLLQADPTKRKTVIDRVKTLYDRRSRYLHGSDVDAGQGLGNTARRLAAAVVIGLMEWHDFMTRMGCQDNAGTTDFFSQIEDAKVTGKVMPGVPEVLAKCLEA